MIPLTIYLNDIEHNDGKMINIYNVVTRIAIFISVKIIAISFKIVQPKYIVKNKLKHFINSK